MVLAELGGIRWRTANCRTLPYITLIRNWSLLAKLVEIGRRVGGVTGVSRNIIYKIEDVRNRERLEERSS